MQYVVSVVLIYRLELFVVPCFFTSSFVQLYTIYLCLHTNISQISQFLRITVRSFSLSSRNCQRILQLLFFLFLKHPSLPIITQPNSRMSSALSFIRESTAYGFHPFQGYNAFSRINDKISKCLLGEHLLHYPGSSSYSSSQRECGRGRGTVSLLPNLSRCCLKFRV